MSAPAESFIDGESHTGRRHERSDTNEYKRRFCYLGTALSICGLVGIFSALISSTVEAQKSYHLEDYVNTHWLTSVFLFAGVSSFTFGRFMCNDIFLYITLALNFVAIPVAFLSLIADALNLQIVAAAAHKSRHRFDNMSMQPHQIIVMMIYSSVDLLGCVVALGLAMAVLQNIRKLTRSQFDEQPAFRSKPLAVLAFVLAALGCVKIALYLKEVVWIRQMGSESRLLFLHYTLDEPVWMAVHVLIGVLALYCALRGNAILMYVSFALAVVSVQPLLMYLWLDYRWFCQVRITELTVAMPKQDHILGLNMFIGAMQLALTGVLLGVQMRLMGRVQRTPANLQFNITADAKLIKGLAVSAVLFVATGMAFLLSDLINLYNRTFYRIFYPTEQKLPLLLFVLGAVTSCVLRKNMTLFAIPAAVLLLLITLHTCVFHVAAFLYLAHNSYHHQDICDMFFMSQSTCAGRLERVGAVSHFVDALMTVGVALLCGYVLVVVMRVSRLHRVQLGTMTMSEMRLKQTAESYMMYLGIVILGFGVIVVGLSINQANFVTSYLDSDVDMTVTHPLIIIHSIIYRSCVALSLVIYPLVQIYYASNIMFHPLRLTTLMAMCIYRFTEVITQLDYRNVGDNGGFAWSLFNLVDVMSMCASFATVCLCAALLHAICNRREPIEHIGGGDVRETTADVTHNGHTASAVANGEQQRDTAAYTDEPRMLVGHDI